MTVPVLALEELYVEVDWSGGEIDKRLLVEDLGELSGKGMLIARILNEMGWRPGNLRIDGQGWAAMHHILKFKFGS